MLETAVKFPSSNGLYDIIARIFEPEDKEKIGIIQIAHGMTEHIEKYRHVADFFTQKGFVVCVMDQAGHGHSVGDKKIYGYFGKSGEDILLKDFHSFYKIIKKKYSNLPYFMLGHSMGSFVIRKFMYVYKNYDINGYLIMGTGYKMLNAQIIYPFAKIASDTFFEKKTGKLFMQKFFKFYNTQFSHKKGNWLSRDEEYVERMKDDDLAKFIFTFSAYTDFFELINFVNTRKWYHGINKNQNIFILSGDRDPFGSYGKGPVKVYRHLIKAGAKKTKLRLYKDYRHELFNEIGKEKVFKDLLEYMNLHM